MYSYWLTRVQYCLYQYCTSAGNSMFKVNNRNTRTIVNFEHVNAGWDSSDDKKQLDSIA